MIIIKIILGIIGFIIGLIIISVIGATLWTQHNFTKKAKKFEKDGNYKEAIYNYAVVILNTPPWGDKSLYKKIKNLSEKYGPFEYDDILQREIEKHGDTPEKCAEAGHAATISIIDDAINKSL